MPVDCIFSKFPEGVSNEKVQCAASDAAIAGNLPCLLDFDGLFIYGYPWSGILIPLYEYLIQEMKASFLLTIIAHDTYQDSKVYSLGQFVWGLAT